MIKRHYKCSTGFSLFIILTVLIITGCARSGPTRFYILSPMNDSESAQAPAKKASLSVGIGPVTLPDYLDRPQIVTRTGNNEIELAEFDKWAGLLKYDIPRVIAENLSVLLKTDHVYTFPWPSEVEPDYQATVSISRFDAVLGKRADLNALWSLYGKRGGKLLMTRKASIRIFLEGTSYKSVAAAQSLALEELSRQISKHIH